MFFGDTNATCQKIERMVRDGGKKCRQEPEEIYAVKGSRKGRSEEEGEQEGCRKNMERKRGGKRQGWTAGREKEWEKEKGRKYSQEDELLVRRDGR
jgi:hypothetical protein